MQEEARGFEYFKRFIMRSATGLLVVVAASGLRFVYSIISHNTSKNSHSVTDSFTSKTLGENIAEADAGGPNCGACSCGCSSCGSCGGCD